MKYEVFVEPGVGASDALLDWLEQQEIVPRVRDVSHDDSSLAEGLAMGAGRFPVLRSGERILVGFDPGRLEAFVRRGEVTGGMALEADPEGRVIVRKVAPGSGAETAGLRSGDVITKLGGYTIFSVDQFEKALMRPRSGRIAIEVRRGGETVAIRVPVPLSAP